MPTDFTGMWRTDLEDVARWMEGEIERLKEEVIKLAAENDRLRADLAHAQGVTATALHHPNGE